MLLAGDINRVDDPTGLTSVEVYNRKRKKWVFSSKIKVTRGYLVETCEHIFRFRQLLKFKYRHDILLYEPSLRD